MAPYRKAPLAPPRLLLRIVAKAGTGALLVACSSEHSPGGSPPLMGTVTNPPPSDEVAVVADTGAADAVADTCPPSGCTGACLSSNTHNVSTMFNGCQVWECCVPDDAGTDAARDASAD